MDEIEEELTEEALKDMDEDEKMKRIKDHHPVLYEEIIVKETTAYQDLNEFMAQISEVKDLILLRRDKEAVAKFKKIKWKKRL